MYKTIIILFLVIFQTLSSCPHHNTNKISKGKSAICILHEDNHSGVKGIVTIHQEN